MLHSLPASPISFRHVISGSPDLLSDLYASTFFSKADVGAGCDSILWAGDGCGGFGDTRLKISNCVDNSCSSSSGLLGNVSDFNCSNKTDCEGVVNVRNDSEAAEETEASKCDSDSNNWVAFGTACDFSNSRQ